MRGADDGPARTGPVLRARLTCPEPGGLRRPRLERRLVGAAAPHLGAVVAGPGTGKTTLLAQAAEAAGVPVAWVTLDGTLDPGALLAHLHAACRPLPWRTPPGEWRTVDEAVAALDDGLTAPALLVLDDADTVDRRRGHVVDTLLRHQPAALRVLVAGRTVPAAVPGRVLAGTARVLDGDALRLRTWEVDELFRTQPAVPLRPAEAAELTRRTCGWVAAVELFRLATRDLPASSRARLLERAGRGPAVADYLVGHVLGQVPAAVHDLLVRTSVLRRLSAARCDALLGTTSAARLLASAHRHGLVETVDDADGTWYECHEVLRGHLLDMLAAQVGGAATRALHRRAADLLLDAGDHADAVRAAACAQDWDAVRRTLTRGGDALASSAGPWPELLPPAVRDTDPWVALALARRRLAEGTLDVALDAYAAAERRARTDEARRAVAHERQRVTAWLEPSRATARDWVVAVREALVRPRPALVGEPVPDVAELLGAGVVALVAGDVRVAARRFGAAQGRVRADRVAEAVAVLLEAACLTVLHARGARDARQRAHTAACLLGSSALERLADGLELAACGAAGAQGLRHLRERCDDVGDTWGGALLGVLAVTSVLTSGGGDATTALDVAADLDALGAPVLGDWARAAAAVGARAVTPAGTPRGAGPVPCALVGVAVGADGWRRLARASGAYAWVRLVALRHGGATRGAGGAPPGRPRSHGATPLPPPDPALLPVPVQDAPTLQVQCLGAFRIAVDGVAVDTGSLRPQHAALLRALALHAPVPVHRDRLVEWFWPGRAPERGQHSLQVAVSDVRRVLDAARPGGGALLRRAEHGYVLGADGRTSHDVRRLEQVLRAGELALAADDEAGAVAALRDAVTHGAAELLAQDGAAEWVVAARERVRDGVVRACATVADLLAARGDAAGAVDAVRRGLVLDRFQDDLWRRLVSALVADGRPAAAAAARREYAAVLRELGVLGVPVVRAPEAARTPGGARTGVR